VTHAPQSASVPWTVRRIWDHAQRQPSAPAVADAPDHPATTYGQLWQDASRIAAALRAHGTAVGDVVALAANRGSEFTTAALGCWLAGVAYLPLDTGHPLDRLRQITGDARPVALLAGTAHRGLGDDLGLAELPAHPTDSDSDARTRTAGEPAVLPPGACANVIYTSGTTGRPKGVEVTHDGFEALLRWTCETFRLVPADRLLHTLGLGFDAAGWEIWMSLAAGATLQACSDEDRTVPGRTAEALNRWRSTLTVLVTPVAEQVLAGRRPLPWLRHLFVGGAELRLPVAAPAQPLLTNLYGPTEATIAATYHQVRSGAPGDRPPIGRPVAGTSVLVLDDDGQPVPDGVLGELYLGGAGIARGYRHDPALTAERFLTLPDRPGRWYRTGDLVHAAGDVLHYRGRRDADQLKVRGIRVEAADIESALMTVPGIEAAAVAVVGHGADADLVALAVAGADRPGASAIRASLAPHLPAGVIPNRYVFVPALPLTANGKLDRPAVADLAGPRPVTLTLDPLTSW